MRTIALISELIVYQGLFHEDKSWAQLTREIVVSTAARSYLLFQRYSDRE